MIHLYKMKENCLFYLVALKEILKAQQHEAPKNFKLFTILQRKYARYFYPYLLNKNALQNQKSL